MLDDPIIAGLRRDYHQSLSRSLLGWRNSPRRVSIADARSQPSCDLAERMTANIGLPLCSRPPSPRAARGLFTAATRAFLEAAFPRLRHLRPGNWEFSAAGTSTGKRGQQEDTAEHRHLPPDHGQLTGFLRNIPDYILTPDIVVSRRPLADEEINARAPLVDVEHPVASLTPLRAANFAEAKPILLASVSCKWTIRSDRSQNVRTEALNLIRNRKGPTPQFVAVCMEPLPSRLASIALGTGDLDCTYHAALHELQAAVADSPWQDARELLSILVNGRRLRDISDLPFDLAC